MKKKYFNSKTGTIINQYLNMKTMKRNYLKLPILSFMMIIGLSVNAQTTDASIGVKRTDAAGASIKLIDNKGTIKYMQSNNGITTITSTATGNTTTTTWQLGGTLVDATTITAGANDFTIDGSKFALENIAMNTATSAAETSSAESDVSATGFTILIRNETTGNIEKLLATEIVSGIRVEHNQGTDNSTSGDATANIPIPVPGLPALSAGITSAKLFVFRNGIKLRYATDFSVQTGQVTIIYDAVDMPMYDGDLIDIQYIK
jgi:hypothetical protein